MIAIIDNYDSFTYNLVHALGALGAEIKVFRNDAISVNDIASMAPSAIIISPGPGSPGQAGISVELIRRMWEQVPILGVCLGHQAVGEAFGAVIGPAGRIMHGKTSMVSHGGDGLYKGLNNPFPAGRYHSLAIQKNSLPKDLIADAFSEDGEIMGAHHCSRPVFGVQFHPESILTAEGHLLLKNFIKQLRA